MMARNYIIGFILLSLLAQALPAQAAPVTTCDELKKLTRLDISAGKASQEAYLDCRERGEDPPLFLRKGKGRAAITTAVGNEYPTDPCKPGTKQQCPNNDRIYTDGSKSPKGYDPANNPNLNIPELPWGKLDDRTIPCGAVATFTKTALDALLGAGKAQLDKVIPLSDFNAKVNALNSQIASLQSLLSSISGASNIPKSQLDATLSSINSQLGDILGNVPVAGASLRSDLSAELGALNKDITDLANAGGNTPQGQVTTLVTNINSHIATTQSLLGMTRDVIAAAQSTANNATSAIEKQVNSLLTSALGNFFKNRDCQNGKFWGILNSILSLVMGKGKYNYDMSNNTFSSSTGPVFITLPQGSQINLNLQNGPPAVNFSLPMGGSFVDAKGYKVDLPPGDAPKFRTDGLIVSNTGSQYRVDPKQPVALDPHDIIGIPAGTRIPVDPNGMVYPAAPITKKPDWFNESYAAGAAK